MRVQRPEASAPYMGNIGPFAQITVTGKRQAAIRKWRVAVRGYNESFRTAVSAVRRFAFSKPFIRLGVLIPERRDEPVGSGVPCPNKA